MAAHAAPTPRRTSTGHRGGMFPGGRSPLAMGLPLLLGIGYGAYAAFMARHGAAASYGQLWLALASGVGFAVIMYVILFTQRAMKRELRSLAWGVFAGGSVGFLRGLGDFSIYRSAGFGLVIGVAVILMTYYWWYTQEQPSKTSSM